MRALLQRVLEASVTVAGEKVGVIGPGLLVFLGVGQGDGDAQLAAMTRKIAELRIFEDEAGKMNRSVVDAGGSVLLVSQFTLYADTSKGRRPSFIGAAAPELAKALYLRAADELRQLGLNVELGIFAADMKVALVNDGPVTLWLDFPALSSSPPPGDPPR